MKVESSQGRVNESLITDNHTLRKEMQKWKPMKVANKMNKSVVKNNMKDVNRAHVVTRMLTLLGMIRICHSRKILI